MTSWDQSSSTMILQICHITIVFFWCFVRRSYLCIVNLLTRDRFFFRRCPTWLLDLLFFYFSKFASHSFSFNLLIAIWGYMKAKRVGRIVNLTTPTLNFLIILNDTKNNFIFSDDLKYFNEGDAALMWGKLLSVKIHNIRSPVIRLLFWFP